MSINNPKVLLSMSGGIDSTVAAILLMRQGYALSGVTYRTWDSVSKGCLEKEKGCCTIDSIMEAKRMAEQMGFDHALLDLREEFKNSVIKNFISEYLSGRTPNPCVVCNAEIKWGEVLNLADQQSCDFIATGHYAQIVEKQGFYYLKKGIDTLKDQTYFLWKLPQNVLKRTLFPLGKLTKSEVRKIAFDCGFEKLSKKTESQEICFIPNNDYRDFLASEVDNFENISKVGNFIDTAENILGQHAGYPNYTVGQRKGLKIALGKPAYVKEIRPETNEIVLANNDDLFANSLKAKECLFVNQQEIDNNVWLEAKIRYRTPSSKAKIVFLKNNEIEVEFEKPVWGVASGQSIVFYKDDLVVGGGIIC